mgnify:CR=1 FL=1
MFVEGGCFCGSIRYKLESNDYPSANCHCSICRRTSGAAFVSWVRVPNDCFDYTFENKPDWIINCGAYTSVDTAEQDKDTAFRINADAPRAFAKALKITGGKIIQISTDYVFNGTQNTPYKTTQQKNPICEK